MATTKSILFRNLCSFIVVILLVHIDHIDSIVFIYPDIWLFFILQSVGVQTWWSGFVSASPTAQDAWPQGFVEWISVPEGPTQYENRNKYSNVI